MAIMRRRPDDTNALREQKLLTGPAPKEPGKFTWARTVGDFVIMDWETALGTVGWAHSLRSGNASARSLADAVYGQFHDHMHEVYTTLVLPQGALNLDLAPELDAIDLYPDSRLSGSYEVQWRQLASVLSGPPPWFSPALRDGGAISAWKPGDPPAIIPASDPEMPAQALTELAADEPDGSPAAAACLWLARHVRRTADEYARQSIDEVRAEAAAHPHRDCAYVHIAAIPAPLLRPEDDQPDEMIMRAGWAQIVERRDVLAAAAAEAVLRWDGGKAWPVGATAQFDPGSCPAAIQWTARLRPAAAGQPPTVLERHLLDHVHSVDRGELLYDDASECPALRHIDHMGKVTVYACVPQRISTVAPLSEVILSDGTVWIRTSDGGLWLAPSLPGRGLAWGYSGSGPHALALLLDRLLEDITGKPIATYGTAPPGLESLLQTTPRDETTSYSRAQLLAAR